MTIATPTTAQKTEDFTSTQLAKVKKDWKLNGNEVFTLTKPSTNHIVPITLEDGFVYHAKNSNTFTDGDTIEDLDSNTFTVSLIDKLFVPVSERINIQIDGSTAYVSNDFNINFIEGEFDFKFGSTGTGDGDFNNLNGVCVANNRIYTVENLRVQIFGINGEFISKFGSSGTGDSQFTTAHAIFVNDSNIYVTDYTNNNCQKFDLDGTFVLRFSVSSSPRSVYANASYIYILDWGTYYVRKYDHVGTYISQFSVQNGDTNYTPHTFCFFNNYLYVYGGGYGTTEFIKIFDLDGTFISDITFGTGYGIAVNEYNIFCINSNYNFKILDHEGNLLNTIGSTAASTAPGEFSYIRYGIYATENKVYLPDLTNDDLQIFK